MKKILSVILALIFVLSMVPLQVIIASANQAGDFTYSIDPASSTATITRYTGYGGDVTVPDSFTYNMVTYKIATIYDTAFSGCTGVTSVKISDNVTAIGINAFLGCTGLTSLNLGNGVKTICASAFQGCTGLVNLIVPNSTTTINANAFKGCTKLSKVILGSGVSLLDSTSFVGCTGLTDFIIDDNNLTYSSQDLVIFNKDKTSLYTYLYPRTGSYVVPNSVTSIRSQAFMNCTQLTGITIPASVKDIGTYTFAGCTGLTGVVLLSGITEIKDYTFYSCSGLKSVDMATSIKKIGVHVFEGCKSLINVTIGSGVTDIGDYAFCNCSGILTLTLPEGLITIGGYSFYLCTSLTDLSIPNSVTTISGAAFAGCKGLKTVVFGSGLKIINTSAFEGCTGLSGIAIPDNVTTLGAAAFRGCSGLESATVGNGVTDLLTVVFNGCQALSTINIGSGVTSIAFDAFSGCISLEELNISQNNPSFYSQDCVLFNKTKSTLIHYLYSRERSYTIPNEVSTIGAHAFENCAQLTAITIPNNVAFIRTYAFFGCTHLNTVSLPQGLSVLEDYVFYGCTGLSSIYLPSSLTAIGNYVFAGCGGLLGADIPYGVKTIGDHAFDSCVKLATVSIPSSVTVIGSYAFTQCVALTAVTIPASVSIVGTWAFSACSSLTSATILSSLTNIPDAMFYSCSSLTSITIPNSVTNIGFASFYRCQKLKDVSISSNASSIGANAFQDCISLSKVIIPDSVSIIGDWAFSGCTSLIYVNIGSKVTSIGTNAFYYCTSLTLVVIPASVFNINATAFQNCSKLYAAYFFGDAPNMGTTGSTVFSGCAPGFTVYHLNTASGFVNYWCGYPTVIFSPITKISITPSTTVKTSSNVTVNITYLLSAVTKQYKINNGGWVDYTEPLTITSNCDIYAQCTDIYGTVTGEGPLHIGNIDKDAPAAPTLTPSTTAATNGNVTVTISYPGDAVIRQYKIDGGNWTDYSAPVVILQNCTISAQCADDVNNLSQQGRLSINNIDKTAPVAPTFQESTTSPTNADVTLTITYAADAVLKQYNINGQPWITYTGSITISSNCTVYVKCADALGNTNNSGSFIITNIDKTAPTAPAYILSVTAPTNKDITLTITYPSEAIPTINEYKIDNGSWLKYSASPVLILNITGNCNVWAKCTDSAGNISQTAIIIDNIDKTPPIVTAVVNNGVYSAGKTIIFNEGTAKLDGNTFLSGNKVSTEGNHTLVVTDPAGNVTTVNFKIVILVASITLNASTLNWPAGQSGKLTAAVLPDNASNKAVSWKSSNTSIATIDSMGTVKAIGAGTATITCTVSDSSGVKATCKINVRPAAPTGVKAVKASSTSIKLTWNKVSGISGYYIYRSASLNGTYSSVKVLTANTYTNTGLAKGKTYYYKIKAYKTVSGVPIKSTSSVIAFVKL
jgi:uncharacterized protein YjdB